LRGYLGILQKWGRTSDIARILHGHANWIRADDARWSIALHSMAIFASHAELLTWASGWRARRASPTALSQIAWSLRHLKRDKDAAVANRMAVEFWGDKETTPHHAWLALDDALHGSAADARTHLARSRDAAGPVVTVVRDLAAAVIDLREGDSTAFS